MGVGVRAPRVPGGYDRLPQMQLPTHRAGRLAGVLRAEAQPGSGIQPGAQLLDAHRLGDRRGVVVLVEHLAQQRDRCGI
ncbi:MAG: hypothetical protein ACRDSN_01215 [Pseudonocardiaceae bacterium]